MKKQTTSLCEAMFIASESYSGSAYDLTSYRADCVVAEGLPYFFEEVSIQATPLAA